LKTDDNLEILSARPEKHHSNGQSDIASLKGHHLSTLEVPSVPNIKTWLSSDVNYQNTLEMKKGDGPKILVEPSFHCLTSWQHEGRDRLNAVKSLNELGSIEPAGCNLVPLNTNGSCAFNTFMLRGGCGSNTLQELSGHGLSTMEDRKHRSMGCLSVSNPGYQHMPGQQVVTYVSPSKS